MRSAQRWIHVALFFVFAALGGARGVARADVVSDCPHVWQEGYQGHGMMCQTSWPTLGAGAAICGMVALAIVGLLFFAMRRTPSARSRGD